MQQNYISTHHFGASGSQKQLRGCIPSTLAHLDSSSNYGAPLGANAIAHGSLVHVPAESATPLTASGAYGYVHSMGNCAAHPLPFYPPTSASVSLTSAPFPSHDAQAQYASPESVNWSTYSQSIASIEALAPDAPSTLNAYPKNLTTSAHITHTHTQSFAAPGHVTFGVDYTVPPTHNLVNVGSGAGTATTPAGLGMGGLAPGGWPLPHIAPIARYRSSDLHPGQTMGGWPKSHDSELGTVHRHTIVPQRDFRDAHHLTANCSGPLSSQVEKDRREAKERQEERKRIHQEKKAAEKAQKEEEKRGRELVHDGGGRKRTRRSVIDDGWTW